MFPMRCYTCNALTGTLHSEYERLVTKIGEGAAMDRMGIRRICCRRMFLGYVDLVEDMLVFPAQDVALDEGGTVLHRHSRSVRVVKCD